jgi:type IV pilus assembly protein PilE
MKLQKGFTLIELLIVVAIIGILATIVLPAYSSYTIRGKIPDATSNLSSKRVAMEQYYQDHRTYVGGPACFTDKSSSQYYIFSCASADGYASTYTITAAGPNTDTSMSGFTYTIDQNNSKTSTIAAPANASWIAPLTSCWITKPGGVC